ncbi:class I SAM-dependent methyltransferase [Patescibacteria group bacterium]
MISQKELDQLHESVPPDYYVAGVRKNVLQRVWHGRRKAVLKKVLTERGGRILDLGCHGGYISQYIHDITGSEVWGIDISRQAIQYGRKNFPQLHLRVGDIQKKTQFASKQFEVITAFDVLEHVPKINNVIQEVRRLLKPEGYFVIGIPLEKKLLFRVAWNLWKKSRGQVWNDVHVHKFTIGGFKKIMNKNKFKEVKIWYSHARTYVILKYQKQ